MFHKNQGMRIDLVLAHLAVADAVTDAYVDRNARKGAGPSDTRRSWSISIATRRQVRSLGRVTEAPAGSPGPRF